MGDDAAIARLESENRALRAEVGELRARSNSVGGKLADIQNDVVALQSHAAVLENLLVASSRLHASLNMDDAVQTLSDILRDLIGAERFAVFLEDEQEVLRPVVTDGSSSAAGARSLAEVDLNFGEKCIGNVVIYSLFSQKKGELTELDHELLRLVGAQAASALLAARVFGERDRRASVLREFVRFLVDGEQKT